jgi:hypothetical protein
MQNKWVVLNVNLSYRMQKVNQNPKQTSEYVHGNVLAT